MVLQLPIMVKTKATLREHYFGPGMSKDVQDILATCATCQVAKSQSPPHGWHTPLPIPNLPWVDVSMNFILSILEPKGKKIPHLWW